MGGRGLMFKLTKVDVAKFQALYKAHFGVDLDYQTAYEKAAKLVRMVEVVYRPIRNKQPT